MEDYIKSPKTGKLIKVSGETYEKLASSKKYGVDVKNARRIKRPKLGSKTHHRGKTMTARDIKLKKAIPRSLKETLTSTPKSRMAKRRTLREEIKHEGEGRGGRTRGWAAAAPQKGIERRNLKAKCGEQCFLKPKTEGFPICAALREGQGCRVDCRGVTSARVRAAQWKYPRVIKEAEKLQRKYC